jgi:hypothetical protein
MAVPVAVPDEYGRQVRRILLAVGATGLLVFGALALAVGTVVRVALFQTRTMDAIVEVSDEGRDRQALEEDVRRRLMAGDFARLDATLRAMRESHEAFANGAWKLTAAYDGLGGLNAPEGFDWEGAIRQAEAWTKASPRTIAPRLVLAELWMASAWSQQAGRWDDGKWDPSRDDAERQRFFERLSKADATLKGAIGIDEYCPHRAATELRLAVSGRWPRAVERDVYSKAVQDEPDYQPYYSLHLYYLEPFWEGAPGEWERDALAIAEAPGGHERYARTVWYRAGRGQARLDGVSWPVLRDGFARLVASHPDSFELESAFCFFASRYRDQPETSRLLRGIGMRMQTTVWADRKQFAQVHTWARFEGGRDPVARWFARLWRS